MELPQRGVWNQGFALYGIREAVWNCHSVAYGIKALPCMESAKRYGIATAWRMESRLCLAWNPRSGMELPQRGVWNQGFALHGIREAVLNPTLSDEVAPRCSPRCG